MNKNIEIVTDSMNLPVAWDSLATHYFQRIEFLRHAEKYNPCHQRYYLLYQDQSLCAAAIVYTLPIDILTYLHVKSPIKMHVIGIPCSVSCPGILGEPGDTEELRNYIFEKEKGFILALNLERLPVQSHHASGKTLPAIILQNNFSSWDDYVSKLRADYRRRLSFITIELPGLRMVTGNCSSFTESMYSQYLGVYKRSKGKLEKLSFGFFKNLPEPFRLTVCLLDERLLGWNITLSYGSFQYFFLGGIDYSQNKANSTYLRLLSNVVKEGIENKVKYIDLGQTAEIPKMKMGGIIEARFMEAFHSIVLFNKILLSAKKLLVYRRILPDFHVFKEEKS